MTPEQREAVDRALYAYWTARDDAAAAQVAKGVVEPGGRAGVTAGAHLDYVAELLATACIAAGAPVDQVYFSAPKTSPLRRDGSAKGFTLPGYYRPTKKWDLVVWNSGVPIVVVELKSQNGPSYGNNANNRAEEAVGNAVDFERARYSGLIPGNPWVGYVYVIEDDVLSSRSGKAEPMFVQPDADFATWSYAERVVELSHRLVGDGLYHGAWPIATSSPSCRDGGVIKSKRSNQGCSQLRAGLASCAHSFDWRELDPGRYGFGRFVDQMTARIRESYNYSS